MSEIEGAGGIPESSVPRPRQQASAFAGLLDRLRERGHTIDSSPGDALEEFMSHAEWEKQRPDELAAAQAYEQHRAYRYEVEHGSLVGWAPRREFPCRGVLRVREDHGPLWLVECDACGYEVGVQVQKFSPERLQEKRLARAGIPPMFAAKPFETVAEQEPVLRACREWIRRFRRSPIPAVMLWGQAGRGKSHLLSVIIKTVIENHGADAMYRSAAAVFDELRAGIDTGQYEAEWRRIQSVPLLAIDDLGASRMTDWQRERLATLMDFRYAHALPMLAATNIPPQGWERMFGDRAASRMRGMMLAFHLEGPDRRAQGVQQSLTEAAA